MQSFAAQVEEAILQAGFLGVFRLAEHRQRQLLGGAENFHVLDENLDLAGRDVLVHQFRIARLHRPVNTDHPFGTHLFQFVENRRILVGQNLRDPVMVAKVDKQHAAMIAHTMHPAGKADILANIGGGQFIAFVRAKSVHGVDSRNG